MGFLGLLGFHGGSMGFHEALMRFNGDLVGFCLWQLKVLVLLGVCEGHNQQH